MIPDRLIEPDTLRTDGSRSAVEVRIPWYRAVPGSCIADVDLSVDGVAAPKDSLRWEMNGRTFRLPELVDQTDEWWFPLDSAVVSGDIPVQGDGDHSVAVTLQLYIPYIVTDHGVLRIEEHDTKSMKATTKAVGR
jgi:hypothetical protein